LGPCKILHLLRTLCPRLTTHFCQKVHELFFRALGNILAGPLPSDAWTVATLPIRLGGVDLPLASDIQAPGYMSSLAQAIYSKVLPEECSSYRDFMEAFHRVLNSPLSPLDSWLPTDRILIDRAHVKFWCKQSWWADILAGKRIQELEQVQSGRVQALLRCWSSTFSSQLIRIRV